LEFRSLLAGDERCGPAKLACKRSRAERVRPLQVNFPAVASVYHGALHDPHLLRGMVHPESDDQIVENLYLILTAGRGRFLEITGSEGMLGEKLENNFRFPPHAIGAAEQKP
jgi:hypothetical protein